MAIAMTLQNYLREQRVPFEVLMHNHTRSSLKTAEAAHISTERLAKAVMLEDDKGYLMAVVPASYRVNLGELRQQLGRNVGLATEAELTEIFRDCELGAIPPVGHAYGVETVYDDALMQMSDIYFEAGDHEELIHVTCQEFMRLMGVARHGRFCQLN
ncbi:MAG: YbaK/EbsC family protein [Betaproteobacteria bacterium]|nr:YbaK/EbsC family protein [Betaproteobacteria bacterium]